MLKVLSSVVILGMLVVASNAADEKPIKSDVVIKPGEKAGTAKVGQVVEIQLSNPALGEDKMVSGLKVTVSGKALESKSQVRDTVRMVDGKPVTGGGLKSIYIKAKAKGTATVKVKYKKAGEEHSHEYEVEVK